eukprot:TRINITY_DN7804_c0_g1_i1.p2 TRINITY_DN7804_c0_g1~~TRINITY_DN7804_c0_g1_i1.p2  ORF type:complete len:387 (+),score=82.95 TRINITY_DN7804_c0_g1_i1:1542-2702(+)
MSPIDLRTYGGIHLLRSADKISDAGTSDTARPGIESMGDVMRLEGLEELFSAAQRKEKPWIGLNVLRSGIDAVYGEYRPEDNNLHVEKGEKCMHRAKRLLQETGGSGIINQWDESHEYYLEAASHFMRGGEHRRAGECYCLASACVSKLGSDIETATDLVKAAECYEAVSLLDSVTCLQKVIEIHASHKRFCKVAKYERKVAQIFEEMWKESRDESDLENVLLHYQEAGEFYSMKGDQYLTERNVCLSKVGGYNALLGRYHEAIAMYELLNRTLTGDKIKADGLFRAMLCFLVDITVDNRLPGIEKSQAAFDHYSDTEPQFQSGKEYELIRSLLWSITKQDMAAFDKALSVYRSCREDEYWRDYMLQKIEKNLVEVLDSVDKVHVR